MRLRLAADPAARRRRTVLAVLCLAALVAGAALGAGDGDGTDAPAPHEAPGDAAGEPPDAVAELPLPEQVGQLVVLRFDGPELPDYAADALRAGRAGGAILFADNVLSEDQLRSLTQSLDRAGQGSTLVATDQEGGTIRNVPFAAPEPAASELARPSDAERSAAETGRDLRSFGVNVNLAPVADVATVEGSALAGRAYPGEAAQVSDLVEAAVRGYEASRVASTAKHFPGLGAASQNTDDAAVTIDRGSGALARIDLAPFRAAIAADVPLVMAGHALYPELDRGRIASQSPAILGDLLRDELGFDGVVVTDSLEAQAVLERSSTPAAAQRSLEAGADLLLTTSSGSYPPVFERLLARARSSAELRARVEEAAARVLALKQRIGLEAPAGVSGG